VRELLDQLEVNDCIEAGSKHHHAQRIWIATFERPQTARSGFDSPSAFGWVLQLSTFLTFCRAGSGLIKAPVLSDGPRDEAAHAR
jgi:hypothetical protein